jgi:uncharacterized protein (TIGR03382 family)
VDSGTTDTGRPDSGTADSGSSDGGNTGGDAASDDAAASGGGSDAPGFGSVVTVSARTPSSGCSTGGNWLTLPGLLAMSGLLLRRRRRA